MKKVVPIILISAIVFCAGIMIAYYNTSSLLYDDVNLFTIYNNGFKIMDFKVEFNWVAFMTQLSSIFYGYVVQ